MAFSNAALFIASTAVLWTPLNITTAMYFSADNTTFDGSNRISQASDLSGNARHAVQGNTNYQPLNSTFSSGQKAMLFDGVNDFLWQSNTSYLSGVSGIWTFTVDLITASTAGLLVLIPFASGNTKNDTKYNGTNKLATAMRRIEADTAASVADTVDRTGSQNINFFQTDYSATDIYIFNNGTQVAINTSAGTSGVADSAALAGTNIGSSAIDSGGSFNGSNFNGKIGCVIIGVGVLSSGDREKLEGWAAHKYGLSANLPSGHPYKSSPPTV